MKELQREILSQVASGAISAEEGAARLEALEAGIASRPAAAPSLPASTPEVTGTLKVRVVSRLGNAQVVGDPSVTQAVAEGPHRAHQEGDTLVIEQSPIHEDSTFGFSRPEGRLVINNLDFGRQLRVRMNPALPLSASVQAGNIRIEKVEGPITAEVQAGNCQVDGFRGTLDVSVAAGNFSAGGRIDGGHSKVRCEMGSVRVKLDKSSSVRITARATLGKVSVEGGPAERPGSGGSRDVTLGSGAGALDIDCTMGNVRVSVE